MTRSLPRDGYLNHAVRTEQWRSIRYADGGEELCDHETDPYEWTNLAGNPVCGAAKRMLAALLPAQNAPDKAGGKSSRQGKPK